jgi:hypothetical protein
MKRTFLIRLGGLAAMVGGVPFAALYLVRGLCAPNCPRGFEYIESVSFVLLILGAMAAIAALHVLQRQSYGSAAGFAFLAFVGVALILVAALGEAARIDFLVFTLLLSGLLLGALGIIALGIVTITAGVMPWWCGVALIAGSPFVGLFVGLIAEQFGFDVQWLWGVPWIVVGFAVFRAAGRRTERPPRVR